MIPVIGSEGWFLMPLRPTRFSPAKLAKLKVVAGSVVQGFAVEREPHANWAVVRRLHWAEGVGSWEERA